MNDEQVSFIGQLLADRYLVERKLGQGSVGTAYRAEDRREGHPVAVKIFNPGIEPGQAATEALLHDARLAARLVSPNLMPTLDVGVHADQFAFVVEPLLAGRSLERRLEEEGPMPPANAVRVGIELLAALEVLHRSGLLHLDVKPSNVFLISDPLGMERAVLAGVGTHHVLALDQAPAKATGDCLARPEYVTPEIVSGKELDETADIYLVGVLLYEMLTGRPPFPGTQFKATARRHALEKPVNPKLVRPQARISDDLDALVMQCLEKTSKRRFAHATALARALETLAQAGFPSTGEVSRFRSTGAPDAPHPVGADAHNLAESMAKAAEAAEIVRREAEARAAQEKAAQEKAAQEKAAQEKAAQEKAAQDKAAQDKAAQDKAAQDKAAQDKAAQDKAAQEKAAQEKAAQEKAAQDKAAQDKAAQDKAAQDKAARDKAAQDQAAQDTAAQDTAAQEKAAADKAAADKAAADKAAADKAAADKAAADKAAADKAAADKAARDKAEEARIRAEAARRAEEAKAESTRRAREAKGGGKKQQPGKKGAGHKGGTLDDSRSDLPRREARTEPSDTLLDMPAFGAQPAAAPVVETPRPSEETRVEAKAAKPAGQAAGRPAAAEAAPVAGGSAPGDDWFVETTEQLEAKHSKLSVYHFQEEKERNLFPYILVGVIALAGIFFLIVHQSSSDTPKKSVPSVADAAVVTIDVVGDAAPPSSPEPPSPAADAAVAAPGSVGAAQKIADVEAEARAALAARRYTGKGSVTSALAALSALSADSAVARKVASEARDALLVESREQVKVNGFAEAREAARTALALMPDDAAAQAQLASIDQAEQQVLAGAADAAAAQKAAEEKAKAEEAARQKAADDAAKAEEAARQKAADDAARAAAQGDAEAKRQAAEAQAQADADAKRQAADAKRQAAEAKAQADADAKRQAAEAKAQADAEAKAAAEGGKEAAAAARKAAEEKKKSDSAARRAAADEKKKADAEAKRVAAEARKAAAAEASQARAEEARKAAAEREKNAGRVAELVSAANGHASAGRWGEARKGYQEVLKLDGGNAVALSGLSEVAFQQGDFVEAARFGERSVQAAPRNADYRVRLGMAWFKQSNYANAKASWERALEISPGHPTATKYLEIVNKRLGQ